MDTGYHNIPAFSSKRAGIKKTKKTWSLTFCWQSLLLDTNNVLSQMGLLMLYSAICCLLCELQRHNKDAVIGYKLCFIINGGINAFYSYMLFIM